MENKIRQNLSLMTQTTVNERIKILIDSLGISVRAFSELVRESNSNVNNYIGERQSMPPVAFLEKLINHIENINPKWLITGREEPFTGEAPTPPVNITNKKNKGPVQNSTGSHATNSITNNVQLEDCKRDLDKATTEVKHLQAQLAAKDDVIASKDLLISSQNEILSLLRGGYNRPN